MIKKIIYIHFTILTLYIGFAYTADNNFEKNLLTLNLNLIEKTTKEKDKENIINIAKKNYITKNLLYRIFFSQVYNSSPKEAEANPHNMDKELIELINTAKKQIYAALHEIDNKYVTNALINAYKRGVEIKIVTDSKYIDEESVVRLRKKGIPVISDKRSSLMHNKFIVVDAKYLWTGSTNITSNGFYKNNNNSILINSKKLAQNFIREFKEMFFDGQFGIRSPKTIAYPIVKLDGKTSVITLFGPENNIDIAIMKELAKAKHSIILYSFSFTHKGIADLLIHKHYRGISILVILEKRQISKYSAYHLLNKLKIPVKKDKNKYNMHHKVIIIDSKTTIIGSSNFSKNASKTNDENILIIKSKDIAKIYLDEFKRLL